MSKNSMTQVVKDAKSRTIIVTRSFEAPLAKVWRAWTEADLLDLWWAPKPWKNHTKRLEFADGGEWLYGMSGPDGSMHWVVAEFNSIIIQKSFQASSNFCDGNGHINAAMPTMHWNNKFSASGPETTIISEISFDRDVDFETIIAMGFEGGYRMGLDNLEQLLASSAQLS